jgi:hypothetical protein
MFRSAPVATYRLTEGVSNELFQHGRWNEARDIARQPWVVSFKTHHALFVHLEKCIPQLPGRGQGLVHGTEENLVCFENVLPCPLRRALAILRPFCTQESSAEPRYFSIDDKLLLLCLCAEPVHHSRDVRENWLNKVGTA